MTFSEYLRVLREIYVDNDQKLEVNRGATTTQIQSLNQRLGVKIDRGLRDAWMVANGGKTWQPMFARPRYTTGYDFLSIAQAFKTRTGMKRRAPAYKDYVAPSRRDRRIQAGWFQDGWLPFASFGGATLMLIQDYSPTAQGTRGQIIAFTHDPDQISFVAPSFDVLLKRSLAAIRNDAEEFIGEEDV